jgi:hypothetical protein
MTSMMNSTNQAVLRRLSKNKINNNKKTKTKSKPATSKQTLSANLKHSMISANKSPQSSKTNKTNYHPTPTYKPPSKTNN